MLLTLAAVARRLGVSDTTARKIVANIPAVRVSKRLRYRAEDLEALILTGHLEAPSPVLTANQ